MKPKGVAIGFRKGFSFALEDTLVDPFGRFLFLRGSLGSLPCTFANLYAPNQGQASFLSATLNKLRDFARGCIVLAGDFNILLEPLLDPSQGKSSISHRWQLHKAQLMDTLRIMHSRERDFMFYSRLHRSHLRIDYFFINHHYLELL